MPQTSIKGQVLADLVAEFAKSPAEAENKDCISRGEQVQTISQQGPIP